jgi:hypothetical protein
MFAYDTQLSGPNSVLHYVGMSGLILGATNTSALSGLVFMFPEPNCCRYATIRETLQSSS